MESESTSDYNQYLAWLAEHPDVRPGDIRYGRTTETSSRGPRRRTDG